jgi:FkbM family methyltransferase
MNAVTTTMKKLAGEVLWFATVPSPHLRRLARPLGERIKPEWLSSRIARVDLANGKSVRMIGFAQSYMTFELHWKGWKYYSPYAISTLQQLLEGAAAFYDVGANVGYYSLFAASEQENLEVVAFEPSPRNFPLLAANAALNGSRIRCVHAALSEATGRATLHLPPSNMSGSLESGFNATVQEATEVHAYSLDDYIDHFPPPGGRVVIKAIVEGHEPSMLRGAGRLLTERRPDMILAVSKRYDDETVAQLRERGYSFYSITDTGLRAESHPEMCLEGSRFFLEHLITTRSAGEVAAISARMLERTSSINQEDTNTHRTDLAGKSVW